MDTLPKISFAIVACTEDRELNRLLEFLLKHKQEQDEIVIVTDYGNTLKEVEIICEEIALGEDSVSWYRKALNKDFSSYKNYLNSRCTGDWIFQIDADEKISYNLMFNLKNIIKVNPTIDVFRVPRENIVDGITNDDIKKWKWKVDEHNRINYPDFQEKIYKNKKQIKWKNKVHERLEGYNKYSYIPINDGLDILHHKTIEKQRNQNAFYEKIIGEIN